MTASRIEALLALVAQDPSDGTSHYMLGYEYFKAQKYPEAVHTLRRYLQLAQDEGAVYRLLAQSWSGSETSRGPVRRTRTASPLPLAIGTSR